MDQELHTHERSKPTSGFGSHEQHFAIECVLSLKGLQRVLLKGGPRPTLPFAALRPAAHLTSTVRRPAVHLTAHCLLHDGGYLTQETGRRAVGREVGHGPWGREL